MKVNEDSKANFNENLYRLLSSYINFTNPPDQSSVIFMVNKVKEKRLVGKKSRNQINKNWNKLSQTIMKSSQNSDLNRKPKTGTRRTIPEDTNSGETLMSEVKWKRRSKHECLAIDCEMVGYGYRGFKSQLARVTLVDNFGKSVYDSYVKNCQKVTDYRTHVSGIRPQHLENAPSFNKVQSEVIKILEGTKLLIGHSIENDLNALKIMIPKSRIMDTSKCEHLKNMALINSIKTASLKVLTNALLGKSIQSGEHSSFEDAKSTMELYLLTKCECN